jgi:ankyrin repeat protein
LKWEKAKKIIIATILVNVVIRLIFCLLCLTISDAQIRSLESAHNPNVLSRLFVTPLEYTAISWKKNEKPILASILVHFCSQRDKNNALCYAAFHGSYEVMGVLLEAGANPNCRMTGGGYYSGYTPLQIAQDKGNFMMRGNDYRRERIIKRLVQAGATE